MFELQVRVNVGLGEGRWAVAQILILIQSFLRHELFQQKTRMATERHVHLNTE